MTSGVKQALPQMPMPKAGSAIGIEGKVAQGRAAGPGFAETLGRSPGKVQSGDAKMQRQEPDLRLNWPRFANKLENADSRPTETAPATDATLSPAIEDPQSTGVATDARFDDETEAGDEAATVNDGRVSDRIFQQPGSDPGLGLDLATSREAAPGVSSKDAPPARDELSVAPASNPASAPIPAITPDKPASPRSRVEPPPVPGAPPARSNVLKLEEERTNPLSASEGKEPSKTSPFVPITRGQQSEPIRFEPVTRAAAGLAEQTSSNNGTAIERNSDTPAEPARTAPRVTIVAQQNVPAPTPSTALVLVDSIAASNLLDPTAAKFSIDAIHASTTHVSTQSLKIQLHPAELGIVTATLRFSGEQLSIELKVENQEAYRRLSVDGDTIVNALRDLGFDVDRVTVLQPSTATSGAPRADGSMPMSSSQGRSAEQFGQGSANGDSTGSGGRSSGEGGNAGRGGNQSPSSQQKDPAGGVYI